MNQDRGYEQSAHLYDLFDNKDNLHFFYHYAAQVGQALDVGAGTGRIALSLAERGIRVMCVEPSPAMRAQFRAKLEARPELRERITLVAGDAASFDLGRTFLLAFLSGSFDHFLDDAERLISLKNIARHLQPGGILLLDVFPGLMKDAPLSPAGQVQAEGRTYRRFVGSRLLPKRRMEVILVFETYKNGTLERRIEQRSLAGLIDRAGVHRVLDEANFTIQQEFSDYHFTPYQNQDPLLVVEARLKD